MNLIVLDFESFFTDAQDERGNKYTLSHLSTEHYIRHPWFEAHGCAIKLSPTQPARWFERDQLPYIFSKIDWSNAWVICHHGQFDQFILSHHYDVHPKFLGCTLSMARLMLGNHLSVSLDSVRKHFDMPLKRTPYHLFKGKHWHEMTPAVREEIGVGACDEVESIWQIFQRLLKDGFPKEELEIVDIVMKMFTTPVLRADVEMLAQVWEKEDKSKNERMAKLKVAEFELQSADKFKTLLEAEGIEIEYKNGKNNPIPCFAKTDEFMRNLLEHDNERVRTLAEARLGAKSTLMQTRAETLGWMASRGALPVYLRYAGAGTLRVSGGDSANWLNFKRGSAIRKSILAPDGYLLAPIDASQIECRVLNYLAGQDDVLEKFRTGEDPYVGLASLAYGETIYKPTKDDPRREEMEQKRGMGKQGELMCGYGAAWKQFQITARNGLYGPPVRLSDEVSQKFVTTYRDTHPAVCAKNTGYWAQADRMIARLAGGPPMDWGPLHVRDHRIYLPNGCPLIYDTIEYHRPEGEELETCRDFERDGYWRMKTRYGWKKMWGSKLVQNICEAVSRVIVSQAAIRINRAGYRILNWPYDELLILLKKDGQEQQHMQWCMQQVRMTPDWLPGIPLDCEGSLSERYSK